MENILRGVDEQILFFFNGYHTAFMDASFMYITQKYTWVPLYMFLLFMIFRKCGWKVGLCMLVVIALAITLSDQVCATYLRPVFERLRPSNPANPISRYIHLVHGYRSGMYGFPSCHAANTTALAVVVALIMSKRRWWIGMVLWAMVVSSSRLYLGVHYPSDIFAGAVIGCMMGLCSYFMIVKIMAYKRVQDVLQLHV